MTAILINMLFYFNFSLPSRLVVHVLSNFRINEFALPSRYDFKIVWFEPFFLFRLLKSDFQNYLSSTTLSYVVRMDGSMHITR